MIHSAEQLPVCDILDELQQALASSPAVVLQAPPGSGKTTRVPLALLDASWLNRQRILMLEPRRLAASNAARYMASLCKEDVGKSVGYSIRYEQKTSPNTRLEVITEGLLTRKIQQDPELKGVGLVIFDEFHERNLQADLALALCRDIQSGLRDDLRILVMSATLDSEPLTRLLDNCPLVTASGRSYPVATHYLDKAEPMRIAEATTFGIRHVLQQTSGDILAFLPGAGEIHRCQEQLQDLAKQVDIRPLFGGLSFKEQEAAILPGQRRRVVLATNVAETSLTIEGIESVVDSGWERRPRYDASLGSTRLETVRISQASATQRAGRAGRLGPGQCYRLWCEGTHGALLPYAPPEVRQADLAPLVFELALWGLQDPSSLCWLDVPPAGQVNAARELLKQLGALDSKGAVTPLGQQMSKYPTDPRLARLLVEAIETDSTVLGCELVALLSERDLLRGRHQERTSTGASDLLERLDILNRGRSPQSRVVRRAADFWRKRLRVQAEVNSDVETIGRLLAVAYPDRIGRRRQQGSNRYLLSNGQGVVLGKSSVVRDAEWLVAVDIDSRNGSDDEIRIASALDREMIESLFGKQQWHRDVGWDDRENRVTAKEVRRLGAIVLQERPTAVTAEDTLPALLSLVRKEGLNTLPWSKDARQLQARAILLHKHLPEQDWPDSSNAALLDDLESWLAGWLDGVKNRNDLQRVKLLEALKAHLGWQRMQELERLLPERLDVPSGSRIRIDYSDGERPVLAVKLQEMFGLAETPRLADGRIPVLIHLLSPAGRPLAVTEDLKSFWDNVYPDVQKEMKGRYPKHPWPDDPWQAQATRKTKRKI